MYHLSDFHCDTITRLKTTKENLYENTGHIDIKKLKIFDAPLLTFAICLDGEGKNCFQETMDYISYFQKELKDNQSHISLVTSYDELLENKKNKKASAILAIEGGEALEGDLENLKKFYDVGVRVLTLTWNQKNQLGSAAFSEDENGLSDFGYEVLKKMEEYKMIIDVSHLNEKGFWDVANAIDGTFVATHSNCRQLCDNPRNLTDKQIIKIVERKGLIGMNLFPEFINPNKQANLSDIINHIDYLVNLGGIDCVCLGSDFDGVSYLPKDVENISSMHILYETLLQKYSKQSVEQIIYGNILKFLKKFLV